MNIEQLNQVEGEQLPVGHDEHSTESQVPEPEGEQQQAELESEAPSTMNDVPSAKFMTLGIGQFVRQMLLKSTKSNAEILAITLTVFPEAKTTMACIAWYKSDLRKKGLLEGIGTRGPQKLVQLSPEDLASFCK